MGRALSRYIVKHYKKITVKRELYERIKKLAEEKQMPMTEVIRMLVEFYEEYGRKGGGSV